MRENLTIFTNFYDFWRRDLDGKTKLVSWNFYICLENPIFGHYCAILIEIGQLN